MARRRLAPSKSSKPKKDEDPPLHMVRGGSICAEGSGAAIIRGTRQPAVCRTTAGADPRSRWRVAGKG